MIEFRVIGPNWAAVRTNDGGVLFAWDVVYRLVEVSRNDGAVFAFEVNVIAVGELQLAHQGVVRVRNLG